MIVSRSRGRRMGGLRLVLAAALGLVVAGCGGSESGGGAAAGAGAKPEAVTVGAIPIADVAPLFLGIDKGFFRDEKLNIKTQFAAGGAAIVPSVLSGDFDFGFSNNVSLFIAQSEGLPLKVVTQGVLGGRDDSEAWADLLVRKDGPVKDAQDLEGATVAVNTLKNICEVTIKATLEKEGVDVSTMKFQEIPFPDMNSALESGQVDAGCQVEPFVALGEQSGLRGVAPFFVGTAPDLSVATYFASQRMIEERPDVVARFTRAMNRSLDYAAAHPEEVRQIIPEYTEIPPEASKVITLPRWSSDMKVGTLETLGAATQKYGLIGSRPNLDELIYTAK
ncbi:MAG: ABC transporter substrate-binding protein [Carbonactinosporaceae bacterium]